MRNSVWLRRLPFFLLGGLYLFHFSCVARNAVDLPFGDEWTLLESNQLPQGVSWEWLLRRHNEHRLFETKLLTWVMYKTDGWNFAHSQQLNFLVFGALLMVFFWLRKRFFSSTSPSSLAWFLIFLLTFGNQQNHFWGFQSCIHFILLFFLLAVGFLFSPAQKTPEILIGSVFALASVYAFASGPVACLALLFFFSVYKLLRIRKQSNQWRKDLKQLAGVIVILGGGIALWFVGFGKAQGQLPPVLPYHKAFWVFFLNLISLGFGYLFQSSLIGFLSLVLLLAPCVVFLKRRERSESVWVYAVAMSGVLGALAAVSVGRAGFGAAGAKTSRYLEIAMLLGPLSLFAWDLVHRDHPIIKRRVDVMLWLFCLGGFSNTNHWHFHGYFTEAQERKKSIACVEKYYRRQTEAVCPGVWAGSFKERLDNAKRLNLSFTRLN